MDEINIRQLTVVGESSIITLIGKTEVELKEELMKINFSLGFFSF